MNAAVDRADRKLDALLQGRSMIQYLDGLVDQYLLEDRQGEEFFEAAARDVEGLGEGLPKLMDQIMNLVGVGIQTQRVFAVTSRFAQFRRSFDDIVAHVLAGPADLSRGYRRRRLSYQF